MTQFKAEQQEDGRWLISDAEGTRDLVVTVEQENPEDEQVIARGVVSALEIGLQHAMQLAASIFGGAKEVG